MTLHELLDINYGADGDDKLRQLLADGANINAVSGLEWETPLHVATRRRRLSAATILLDNGADINAKTAGGKTAYAHAIRRRFTEMVALFADRGADTTLNLADQFAVAVVNGKLDEARQILAANPGIANTGNPEEDRLLADVAGRNPTEPVTLLIAAGANLSAPGLDDGTALHQAAWFGQPENARLLIDAGAPLEIFDGVHTSSPLGWAVHGSRYSGDAAQRETDYIAIVRLLLDAGAKLHYPGTPDNDDYYHRLLTDASPGVAKILRINR